MNYYELLEVDSNASMEVIKNAYKTLAKKFHPDTYAGDRIFAEEKMKLLNEAMSVLEDEEKRKIYNIENNIGIRQEFSTVFGSPDSMSEERKHTFMDDIDDFLGDHKPNKAEKHTRTAKPSGKKTVVIDDIEDIENISSYHNTKNYKKNKSDLPANDRFHDLDIDVDLDDMDYAKNKRKKNKPQVGKWYYITVAALAVINIVLILLIVSSIDFSNIKNLISPESTPVSDISDSEGVEEIDPEGDYAGENNGDEYNYMMAAETSTNTDNTGVENETGGNDDIPKAADNTAETTQNNIQPTTPPTQVKTIAVPPTTTKAPLPTKPPATKAPSQSKPTQPATQPPVTIPSTVVTDAANAVDIANEPESVEQTTREATEDIIESIEEIEATETTETYIKPTTSDKLEQPVYETDVQNTDAPQPETDAPEEKVPDFIAPETIANDGGGDNADTANEEIIYPEE